MDVQCPECCMSGCAVCVYDLYEEALQSYEASLQSLRRALDDLKVPEFKRPLRIQRRQHDKSDLKDRERNVVISAFEAFEKSLRAKHAAQSQS